MILVHATSKKTKQPVHVIASAIAHAAVIVIVTQKSVASCLTKKENFNSPFLFL